MGMELGTWNDSSSLGFRNLLMVVLHINRQHGKHVAGGLRFSHQTHRTHAFFFHPKNGGKTGVVSRKNHNPPTFNHLTYRNTFRCCLLSSFAGRIFPGAPWFFAFYDVKHEHCCRVVRSGWLVAAACIWGETLGWFLNETFQRFRRRVTRNKEEKLEKHTF